MGAPGHYSKGMDMRLIHRTDGLPKTNVKLTVAAMQNLADKCGGKLNSKTLVVFIPWDRNGTFMVSVSGDVMFLAQGWFIKAMEMSVRSYTFKTEADDPLGELDERLANVRNRLRTMRQKSESIISIVKEQIALSAQEIAQVEAYINEAGRKAPRPAASER